MPVGRVFNDLTVFDLLGNFIPGTLLLASITLLLPEDRAGQITSAGAAELALFAVFAFGLGHLIQSYAAKAVGEREKFKNSILEIQSMGNLPDLQNRPSNHTQLYRIYKFLYPGDPIQSNNQDDISDEDSAGNDGIWNEIKLLPARGFRSLIEAAFMLRIKRDGPLESRELAAKFWRISAQRYDLDGRKFRNYGDLMHFMSSELENDRESSRALRFQAIRNFQRGMWIALYLSGIIFITVAAIRLVPSPFNQLFSALGITVWSPIIADFRIPAHLIGVSALLSSYFFWELKEIYEDEFIEYLLVDYIIEHINDLPDQNNEWNILEKN